LTGVSPLIGVGGRCGKRREEGDDDQETMHGLCGHYSRHTGPPQVKTP
jgi:hypothetical protein